MNEQQWPTGAQPGWFPDPGGTGKLRYFDGHQWTSNFSELPPPPTNNKSKGRLVGLSVLGLLLFGACVTSLGDSDKKSPSTPSSTVSFSAAASPPRTTTAERPQPLAPLGQEVRDGKFSFVVTSVDVTNVGGNPDNQFETVTPKGKFINVHVTVTNVGDRAQTFFASNQNLIVGGKKYEADSTASFWSGGMSDELNPGISEDYVVAFDVPVNTQTMDYIELHDSAFSGGVKAGLG